MLTPPLSLFVSSFDFPSHKTSCNQPPALKTHPLQPCSTNAPTGWPGGRLSPCGWLYLIHLCTSILFFVHALNPSLYFIQLPIIYHHICPISNRDEGENNHLFPNFSEYGRVTRSHHTPILFTKKEKKKKIRGHSQITRTCIVLFAGPRLPLHRILPHLSGKSSG